MNRITSADIIDNGEYIIGEKYKVINYLLNGIYQQIEDYNKEIYKDSSESSLENLKDNMKNLIVMLDYEPLLNLDDLDIIKVDYSNDYYGLRVDIYEKKNI